MGWGVQEVGEGLKNVYSGRRPCLFWNSLKKILASFHPCQYHLNNESNVWEFSSISWSMICKKCALMWSKISHVVKNPKSPHQEFFERWLFCFFFTTGLCKITHKYEKNKCYLFRCISKNARYIMILLVMFWDFSRTIAFKYDKKVCFCHVFFFAVHTLELHHDFLWTCSRIIFEK